MSEQKDSGEAIKAFLAKGLHPKVGDKPPEPPKPEPAPAPEPAAVAPVTEEPAPAPTPAPEPPVRRRQQKVDPAAIAEEAARLATEKMKAEAPPVAPVVQPEKFDIPEDYKDRYEVIKYMASKNPKYADLPGRYEKFMRSEAAYIQKWVKDHNGEEFDGADPAHNDFYEKNLPKYSESDFRKAEISREAERITEEKSKEFDQKFQKLEEEKTIAGLGRQISEARTSTIMDVAQSINADLAPKFKTQEGFKEVEELDPLVADAVLRGASAVAPMVDASVQLYRSNGAVKYNPNNSAHVQLAELATELEKSISSLPMQDRTDNEGRMFTTRENWGKMSDAQKQRHWFIGEEEINFALSEQAKATAKDFYETEKKRLDKYSAKLAPRAPAPAPAPKPSSAPAGGGDKFGTLKIGTPAPAKTLKDTLAGAMFPSKG